MSAPRTKRQYSVSRTRARETEREGSWVLTRWAGIVVSSGDNGLPVPKQLHSRPQPVVFLWDGLFELISSATNCSLRSQIVQ
jgi:hypothetical protein